VTDVTVIDPSSPSPGPAHVQRPQLLAVGVMIWLGSEFMFFSGLFAAFFTIRANAKVWPPAGTKLDTYQALVFTFVLLASSPTMQMGVWAEERGERVKARFWVVVSLILAHQRLRLALLHHVRAARFARAARSRRHDRPVVPHVGTARRRR
jgi:heme/copper-type cytochrome/quinol oxidase subunit 3